MNISKHAIVGNEKDRIIKETDSMKTGLTYLKTGFIEHDFPILK